MNGIVSGASNTSIAPIRIAGLHLVGITKDYGVSFRDDHGEIRPLSIIAGEISTGKTSVLELIDYCLGANTYPQHEEIVNSVRGVRLELEIREIRELSVEGSITSGSESDKPRNESEAFGAESDEVARFVLERAIPGPSALAFLFRGDFGLLDNSAPRRLSLEPNEENSVSQFLLTAIGLGGLRLRVAPTKPDSKTHILSFRDVTPLYFLTHRRLDNGNLALEHHPHRHLKLQQVVDYFFGVSDEALSNLASQIEELTKRRVDAKAGIKALRSFLHDHGAISEIALEMEAEDVSRELHRVEEGLREIDRSIKASTNFASEVRQRYDDSARRVRSVSAELRERETLLARLSPLRSQYADDLRKMTMLIEARRLFDPLTVTVCPACQSDLAEAPQVVNEICSLCRSTVPSLVDESLLVRNGAEADSVTREIIESGDLDVEHRSVSSRLKELAGFMTQLEEEAAALRAESRRRADERSQLQLELDTLTRDAITPYLTERDFRGREIARLRAAHSEIRQRQQLLVGLGERENEEERIAGALQRLRDRSRELPEANTTRDAVIAIISERFASILADFGFPKLSNAYVNNRLIPHARMLRYDQIGSSGAMTLLSLAWQLAIFEISVERGSGHPGFLMIDSPQKNLKAKERTEWDAETANSIVDRVYRHILGWLASHSDSAQIIIVDNVPPQWVEDHVVVTYSGRGEHPPYGLIDDAII